MIGIIIIIMVIVNRGKVNMMQMDILRNIVNNSLPISNGIHNKDNMRVIMFIQMHIMDNINNNRGIIISHNSSSNNPIIGILVIMNIIDRLVRGNRSNLTIKMQENGVEYKF